MAAAFNGVIAPNEGIAFAGSGVVCKVCSADVSGAFTVLELVLPPGAGAPLHLHQREDEIVYVVAGELLVCLHEQTHSAPQGSTVVFGRGVPHWFRNAGEEPCCLLITAVPGGLDGYFAEVGQALAANQPDELAAINRKYAIEFLTQ